MITYADAIKMTPEELHDHPEVEQCACAHARGLHTYGRESRHQCKGRYTDGSVNTQCGCTEFKGTGLRLKNSLISLPVESRADAEVSPALIEHRKAVFNDLDPSRANDPAPWWLKQLAAIEVEMNRQQKDLPPCLSTPWIRYIAAAVLDERERCASLAEGEVFGHDGTPEGIEIARLIRGRQ